MGCYGMPNADRIAWSRELYERASRAGDIPKAINAASQLSTWQIETGDFDAYADSIATALALSEGRHPRYRWEPLLLASGQACALGRFADSDRYVTEVMQIAALIDDPALATLPYPPAPAWTTPSWASPWLGEPDSPLRELPVLAILDLTG